MRRKPKVKGMLPKIMNLQCDDNILMTLERKGIHVIASDFTGVSYVQKDGSIIILAGKNGALAIDANIAYDFLAEIAEVVDHVNYRKFRGCG